MMSRVLRLYRCLTAYFTQNLTVRALYPLEWQAALEVTSILDPAAMVNTQIQGGRHAFVGKAINDFTMLYESFAFDTQDIRTLDPPDGPLSPVATGSLVPEVKTMLKILLADMNTRKLGHATLEAEMMSLVLDPRYKTCCEGVCRNGGDALKKSVSEEVTSQLSYFVGHAEPAADGGAGSGGPPGAGAGGSEGTGAGLPGPGDAGAAGSGAGGAPPPPAISRLERLRLARNIVPQCSNEDGTESRADAALREFGEYMKTPVAANSPDFDVLNAWKAQAMGGVDAKTGEVVVPARWPHVGLLARLYLGIDTTSCQAERNFSALSAVVSQLRTSLGADKIEKMMLLKLNSHLIPGLAEVLQDVAALKANCDAEAAASVAAQNAAAGEIISVDRA